MTTSVTLARRLAVSTALATLLLIVAGGLVTNTGSALAVPDWPTTFGYSMFTYPWAAMVGGVFYEHSHRLLGSLVGLLTIGLAAALWPAGGRLRALGLLAVGAVVIQGVLGGLRVVLLEFRLAVLHGCLAQAYLALIVVIGMLVWPRARLASSPLADDRTLRALAFVTAAVVYGQIVFGALLTHLGLLELHLAGAVTVFALVPVVTARARRAADSVATPLAIGLVALLGVQLVLGIGAWLVRFTDVVLPGGTSTGLALPVTHRLVGSLILATAVALALRIRLAASTPRIIDATKESRRPGPPAHVRPGLEASLQ
jgi:cytochrome c oxidase assembly protein subunit 15